jgi:hypothetical protein
MSIRNRVKKIEKKLGINSEDEEFFKYYATLENPAQEIQNQHFLLCLKKYGLEAIVVAAHKELTEESENEK